MAGILLMLNLSLAPFCLGMGGAGFPLLPLHSVLILIVVDNGVFRFPLNDRSSHVSKLVFEIRI